jgi:hypothetical protein
MMDTSTWYVVPPQYDESRGAYKNKNLIYISLDVDDTQYHGAALDKETGEIVSFKCRPTLKGLVAQLEKMQKYFEAESLKLCYEASYVGHCLQSDLMQASHDCDVISPGAFHEKDQNQSRQIVSMHWIWLSSTPTIY